MKQTIKISCTALILVLAISALTGCKKFAGLERQTDWNFEPHVLDPHINMNAWQFLKSRALGTTRDDTIFKKMYDGIVYAGIDTNEYTKPDRTFIFLHNDAIYRLSSNKITTDCYWGYYKTAAGKTGAKWSDYPKEQVKNWLLYLIAEGEHTFENMGPNNDTLKTLEPLGADPKNPESIMLVKINNDQNSRFRINDFIGTVRYTEARTAGIISTNGPVHVVDRVVEFGVK